MIFIFLLKLHSVSSLCSKATFEGAEYILEAKEGKVHKQCKTGHIFYKDKIAQAHGVGYCLSKANKGRRSSISCGDLKIPKAEILSGTLSECSCDKSDNTKMEVGIAGGQDENDPKWTVAIAVSQSKYPTLPLRDRTFCTGSLITRTTVLTAAHCMYMEYSQEKKENPNTTMELRTNSKGYAKVVSGILHMNNMENATVHEIEDFWLHPGYKKEPGYELMKDENGTYQYIRSNHQDDLAVLRIEKLTIKVYSPICLPPKNDDPYANICVKLSGWGRTRNIFNETDTDYSPNTLQGLKTKTITKAECRTIWKDALMFPDERVVDLYLSKLTICPAGILGKSTCNGDSGGPMAFSIKENGILTSYLIGVMSFAPSLKNPCGSKEPHVLMRVALYVEWIRTKMEGEQPPRCSKYWSNKSCACC